MRVAGALPQRGGHHVARLHVPQQPPRVPLQSRVLWGVIYIYIYYIYIYIMFVRVFCSCWICTSVHTMVVDPPPRVSRCRAEPSQAMRFIMICRIINILYTFWCNRWASPNWTAGRWCSRPIYNSYYIINSYWIGLILASPHPQSNDWSFRYFNYQSCSFSAGRRVASRLLQPHPSAPTVEPSDFITWF